MFHIEKGADGAIRRLVSCEQLTRNDFRRIAEDLGVVPFRARKTSLVAATRAVRAARIETRWNGKETVATAEPGDWITTNMASDGTVLRDAECNLNVYIIKADRFPDLYDRGAGSNEHGDIYRPRGVVQALFLPGGFVIKAPWGETQRAVTGYLIDNGSEIYGNAKETFERTYRIE